MLTYAFSQEQLCHISGDAFTSTIDQKSFKPMTTSHELQEDALVGRALHLRQGVKLQVCHSLGKSPALVFLHGGLGNRFNLRSQYEFAISQGWEALIYDLAGHGQSSPYPRYSIGRHCRDLARLLDCFNISAPILCCHSYGVPIGLEFAQVHPVSGIIAIAGGTHELDPWWEIPLMKSMTWFGRHIYRLPSVQKLSNFVSTSYHNSVMERFFQENPTPTDFHAYTALEIFWAYNFFSRHPLPQVGMPILAITGGKDPMFTARRGDELVSHFSHRTHVHVPQAGHLVMAECPDVVNLAISNFYYALKTK